MNIEEFKAVKQYDAVALIYVHLAPGLEKGFMAKLPDHYQVPAIKF